MEQDIPQVCIRRPERPGLLTRDGPFGDDEMAPGSTQPASLAVSAQSVSAVLRIPTMEGALQDVFQASLY